MKNDEIVDESSIVSGRKLSRTNNKYHLVINMSTNWCFLSVCGKYLMLELRFFFVKIDKIKFFYELCTTAVASCFSYYLQRNLLVHKVFFQMVYLYLNKK